MSFKIWPKNESQNFLHGTIVIFSGLLMGKLLAMANSIVMARMLSVEVFGTFMLAISVFEFFLIPANLGIPSILPKFIAEYKSNDQYSKINDTFSVSLYSCSLIATIFAITIYIFAPYIANQIFKTPSLKWMIRTLMIVLPIAVATPIMLSVYRGYEITRGRVLFSNFLPYATRIPIFLFLFSLNMRIEAAIFAYFLSYIIIYLFLRIDIYKSLNVSLKVRFYNHDLAKILKMAWPLMIQTYIWIIYTKIGRLFIGYYLNPENVGIYSAAANLAGMIALMSQSFSFLALPKFSKIMAQNSLMELTTVYRKISSFMFFMAFPMFVVLVFASKDILSIIYGPEFSPGSYALLFIGGGMLSRCLAGPAADSLISAGWTKAPLISLIIGCSVNVILNFHLIPKFGINGAAAANCIGMICQRITLASLNYKYLNLLPFSKEHIVWLSTCLILTPAIFSIKLNILNTTISNFLLAGILYLAIAYFILFYFFRFTNIGKEWISELTYH